jgi:hypothetical protein
MTDETRPLMDGSEQVMWSRRLNASNAVYVAANRFCRRFEDVDQTYDRRMWVQIASALGELRRTVEDATREVG